MAADKLAKAEADKLSLGEHLSSLVPTLMRDLADVYDTAIIVDMGGDKMDLNDATIEFVQRC